jgi:hypothetical protein
VYPNEAISALPVVFSLIINSFSLYEVDILIESLENDDRNNISTRERALQD